MSPVARRWCVAAVVGVVVMSPVSAVAQSAPLEPDPAGPDVPAAAAPSAPATPDAEPSYGAGTKEDATVIEPGAPASPDGPGAGDRPDTPDATAGPDAQGGPDTQGGSDAADGSDATAESGGDLTAPVLLPGVNPYGDGFLDIGAPRPVVVGSGVDALLSGPPLRGANEPTLLERFGAQGHTLDEQRTGANSTDRSLNAVAGWLFAVAAWLALAVTATVQWAFTVDVFSFLGDTVSAVVGALRGTVYTPFVVAAIALAGVWAAWHGLVRRRGTRAAEGLAWAVGALVAAGLFFANPGAIIDAANTVSTEISRGSLAAVALADPGSGPDDGVTTTATFDGHPADAQLRLAADRFWRVFVHQPWLVLQFGDAQTGAVFAEELLEAKTIQPDEAEALSGDPEAMEDLVAAKQEAYLEVQERIMADPAAAEWFRGRRAVERVGIATLALVGVLLGGVLMGLIAVALLLSQVGLLLVVLLAPLALLIGIHPGAGRILATRWAGLALGLLCKRVVLGVLLAVVLVVNGVLLDATYPLGWLVVMGLQSLVVAAAVAYRAPLARLIGPTTFPVVVAGAIRAVPAAGAASPGAEAQASESSGALVRAGQPGRRRRDVTRARRPWATDVAPASTGDHEEPASVQGHRRVSRRARDQTSTTTVEDDAQALTGVGVSHTNGHGPPAPRRGEH